MQINEGNIERQDARSVKGGITTNLQVTLGNAFRGKKNCIYLLHQVVITNSNNWATSTYQDKQEMIGRQAWRL
jgi:hypothetical protein